jgi:hypothetical protein
VPQSGTFYAMIIEHCTENLVFAWGRFFYIWKANCTNLQFSGSAVSGIGNGNFGAYSPYPAIGYVI